MSSTPADFFSFVGSLSRFGVKSLVSAVTPPYEWQYFLIQIEDVGWRSLPLIAAAGLALGVVTALHTRGTLVSFGAEALIPSLQSASFFNELGPLVTGLLISGRVGCGHRRGTFQHAGHGTDRRHRCHVGRLVQGPGGYASPRLHRGHPAC